MLKKGGEFLSKQEKFPESSDKLLENINELKRKYENLSKLCENTCYKHFIERLSEEKIGGVCVCVCVCVYNMIF